MATLFASLIIKHIVFIVTFLHNIKPKKHKKLAKKFEIPLNGALHMKIVLESKVYNCFYGFADGHFE